MQIHLPLILSLSLIACGTKKPMLEVAQNVDLKKYAGTWYEIARLPNSFEKNLDCISATYTLKENGKIEVLNKGYYINDHSRFKDIKGHAKVPDSKVPGKLKVTFFWPFYGNYWILELDKDYQYALVGDPSLKYLWILCRERTMSEDIYQKLISSAKAKGFDVSAIIKVNQKL